MWSVNRVVIVGLGLIGGSVAARIKAVMPSVEIVAVDVDRKAGAIAMDKGWVDRAVETVGALPTTFDLAILCTPMETIVDVAQQVSVQCESSLVMTDVSSVKGPMATIRFERSDHHFVGGHPMAGKEVAGIAHADADLLNGAPYVVVPGDEHATSRLIIWLQQLGVVVHTMSAERHDTLVAQVSHVPYLMASLLVESVDESAGAIQGGGFRDSTRVAGHDPAWGAAVCQYNREAIMAQLETTRNGITTMLDTLSNEGEMMSRLEGSHAKKKRLG